MGWSKYGAVRCGGNLPELAARSFASQLERDRATELCLLQRAGHICELEFQPTIYLTEAKIGYHPDFGYIENGITIFEETKGLETDRWRIIRKLWRFYGPAPLRVFKRVGGKLKMTEEIKPCGRELK